MVKKIGYLAFHSLESEKCEFWFIIYSSFSMNTSHCIYEPMAINYHDKYLEMAETEYLRANDQ